MFFRLLCSSRHQNAKLQRICSSFAFRFWQEVCCKFKAGCLKTQYWISNWPITFSRTVQFAKCNWSIHVSVLHFVDNQPEIYGTICWILESSQLHMHSRQQYKLRWSIKALASHELGNGGAWLRGRSFHVWCLALTPKRCNIQYEESVIEISPPGSPRADALLTDSEVGLPVKKQREKALLPTIVLLLSFMKVISCVTYMRFHSRIQK